MVQSLALSAHSRKVTVLIPTRVFQDKVKENFIIPRFFLFNFNSVHTQPQTHNAIHKNNKDNNDSSNQNQTDKAKIKRHKSIMKASGSWDEKNPQPVGPARGPTKAIPALR